MQFGPDGHCVQLYHGVEQIGWDGRPRPAAQRPRVVPDWPQTLEASPDSYVDQILQGPLRVAITPHLPGMSSIELQESPMSVAFKGRREDLRLLTGQGRYTADWDLPGQAHRAFSPG